MTRVGIGHRSMAKSIVDVATATAGEGGGRLPGDGNARMEEGDKTECLPQIYFVHMLRHGKVGAHDR